MSQTNTTKLPEHLIGMEYGCVKCQKTHVANREPELFMAHLTHQSKHGYRKSVESPIAPTQKDAKGQMESNPRSLIFLIQRGWANTECEEMATNLIEAAKEAADWLCDCQKGSDQFERGVKLANAISEAEGHR